MLKLFFTPLAAADLDGVLDYIAEHRPQTAKKVVQKIWERCEKICSFPEMGQVRPEFPGNYRSTTVQRWVLFYRVVEDRIEIHRVLDSARDIDSLLGS